MNIELSLRQLIELQITNEQKKYEAALKNGHSATELQAIHNRINDLKDTLRYISIKYKNTEAK
jgi:hypothetical protein